MPSSREVDSRQEARIARHSEVSNRNAGASRSVLITGAASGIGAGLARHLARAGHRVFLSDVDTVQAAAVARDLQIEGARVSSLDLDVCAVDSIEAALRTLGDDAPDVLINNAGLQYVAPLEEFPLDKWRQLIDVMLFGAVVLTRGVLPGMRRRGYGRIVNIGSIHSLVGSPFKSAYVAAKHGMTGFSKVVALETGDVDVTINTICPSYVLTPLVEAQIDAQARTHGIARERVIEEIMLHPMPKRTFVTVEELGGIVEFLMSAAARNITAQCLAVDGGWTAQ